LKVTRHKARELIREHERKGIVAPAVVTGNGGLSYYDAGCRALAQAKTLEEVRDFHNRAAAMAEYFRRANERAPLMDLLELRTDAAKRYGEMLAETKGTVGLAKGGRPAKEPVSTSLPVSPTLADLGTTKRFSSYAQKLAALPDDEYQARKEQWRTACEASPKVPPYDPLKPDPDQRREDRRAQMRELAANPLLLPQGPFACGVADPPWENPDAPMGHTDRHYRQHYGTMTPHEIATFRDGESRAICEIFAPTAFLALWVTRHILAVGAHIEVVRLWGFEPKTVVTWDKQVVGLGNGFTRDVTEHIVFATRGTPAAPSAEQRVASLFEERKSGKHSEKPDWPQKCIEMWFPEMSYVELFARSGRDNWTVWGNEAPTEQ
jgi:N6-adenosine-specific RNA methylase IME4